MNNVPEATAARLSVEQLAVVMRVLFGATRTGAPDAQAAAAALGISPSQVRRWLAEPHTASHNQIPAETEQLLRSWARPKPVSLRQAELTAAYARDATKGLAQGIGERDEVWTTQRWLVPHLLSIVALGTDGRDDHPYLTGLARPTITRAEPHLVDALRTRGTTLEMTELPHRFAAQVVKDLLLSNVDPWRVAPSPDLMRVGSTEAWLRDAPRPSLEELRAETLTIRA